MRFTKWFGMLVFGLAASSTGASAAPQAEHGRGAERSAAAHSNGHGYDDVIHAPPPVYPTFEELTGIQTLATAGVAYGFPPSSGAGVPAMPFSKGVEDFGSGVTAMYDPASGDVTYTAPDGKTASFTSADIIGTPTANGRQYLKTVPVIAGGAFSVPSVAGVPLTYTRAGTFFVSTPTGIDGHTFVMGVPTVASDLPTSGTATYTTVVGGSAYVGLPGQYLLAGNSSATFTADFGTGQISTDVTLVATPTSGAPPIFLDTLTGTGALGGVKPGFAGTFAGTGTVGGDFGGAFFGPQAAEMGYDFVVGGTNANGRTFGAIGAVFGTK